MANERRKLPWTKVGKTYLRDGSNGKESLSNLFGGCRLRVRQPAAVQRRFGGENSASIGATRGAPPKKPIVLYGCFLYRAASWNKWRRVVAKVEWHKRELFPRVGFIVTSRWIAEERVVRFYNGWGTAEQWIREGKQAIKWTRLSCRQFAANQVRLQFGCSGVQLGEFCSSACTAAEHPTLVPDDIPGETHQDRRQGRATCRVCHVPDGRPTAIVRPDRTIANGCRPRSFLSGHKRCVRAASDHAQGWRCVPNRENDPIGPVEVKKKGANVLVLRPQKTRMSLNTGECANRLTRSTTHGSHLGNIG